jgi:hypothetical protein
MILLLNTDSSTPLAAPSMEPPSPLNYSSNYNVSVGFDSIVFLLNLVYSSSNLNVSCYILLLALFGLYLDVTIG